MAPDDFKNLGLVFEGDNKGQDQGTNGASVTKPEGGS